MILPGDVDMPKVFRAHADLLGVHGDLENQAPALPNGDELKPLNSEAHADVLATFEWMIDSLLDAEVRGPIFLDPWQWEVVHDIQYCDRPIIGFRKKLHEYQQEGMKSLREGVRPMLFSEYISAHKSAQGKLEAVLNRML